MNRTADINAIINQAKQQRADYIASKLQGPALPFALVAVLSLVLVSLVGEPSQDQAQHQPVAEVSAHNG